jgi:hypothetical protein
MNGTNSLHSFVAMQMHSVAEYFSSFVDVEEIKGRFYKFDK